MNYCNFMCGCAGAQLANECEFEPSCIKCENTIHEVTQGYLSAFDKDLYPPTTKNMAGGAWRQHYGLTCQLKPPTPLT